MLKKNLIANFIGQGWVNLISILFIPLYIRYLGIEAYALISFFTLLHALVMVFDMGMVQTLSQQFSKTTNNLSGAQSLRNLLRSIEMVLICVAVLACFVIYVSSGWLAHGWLQVSAISVMHVKKAIVIMGFVIALRFIENIYYNCLVGMQEQVAFNVINSSMATLRCLGAVAVLIFVSPTIEVFFIWQGFVSIITIIILYTVVYKRLPDSNERGRFELSEIRAVWGFSSSIMVIAILNFLLTQVDKILLSRLLTLEDFGYYSLATVIASALVMLVAPIDLAFFPKLNSLVTRKYMKELTSTYHMASQFVSVLIGAVAITIILFSEELLVLWTHDLILVKKINLLVMLLSLGALLSSLLYVPYRLQLSHGWADFMVKSKLVAICVLLPSYFLIIPKYGVMGAAVMWIIFNFLNLIITIEFLHKKILLGEKSRWYLNDTLMPILTILFTGLLIRTLLTPMITGWAGELILLIFAGLLMTLTGVISAPILRKHFFLLLKNRLLF